MLCVITKSWASGRAVRSEAGEPVPRLRTHPTKAPLIALLAREGQIDERTSMAGTPYAQRYLSVRRAMPGFRPYVWHERERHPVLAPEAAEAFAAFAEGR